MTNWDDLRVFLALQREGSLARAARRLQVDATTVGRRLAALEKSLETTLFERTPSGLVPTATGSLLVARAERIEDEMLASERELRGRDSRLEGPVVVTAGDGIATYLLVPWFVDLRRVHPRITLELRSEKTVLDIARREADVAVRLVRPKEASLVAKRAGDMAFAIYGSDAYFARRGKPRTSEDLAVHEWIAWDAQLESSPQSKWLTRHAPQANVCLRANTTTALIAACAAGHGLALLPTFAVESESRLVPVLPRLPTPNREMWIVTHEDSRKSARVRAIVDWLVARFGG